MKFTDGYWRIQPGVTPHFAVEVNDVQVTPDALLGYAPTKHVAGRGDTLDQPLLTVRYSTPMPNVIRAQMWRHKGGVARYPVFELEPQEAPATQICDCAEKATITSGQLTVNVQNWWLAGRFCWRWPHTYRQWLARSGLYGHDGGPLYPRAT